MGKKFAVISAYRPCLAKDPSTVFQQQTRGLDKAECHIDPRYQFIQDLVTLIKDLKEKGFEIIVMMDANNDVRTGEVTEAMEEEGLREIFKERFPNKSQATQSRNRANVPIDRFYTSPGINPQRMGYNKFGEGCPLDHRVIWADFLLDKLIGKQTSVIQTQGRKKINIMNSRSVDKYNFMVRSEFEKANLFEEIDEIAKQADKDGWSI